MSRQHGRRAVTFDPLQINLLVLLVDIGHTIIRQTEGAAAIFVDPAAQRDAWRRQTTGRAVTPVPERAASVRRVVFDPQQPAVASAQLGEIAAGAGSLLLT